MAEIDPHLLIGTAEKIQAAKRARAWVVEVGSAPSAPRWEVGFGWVRGRSIAGYADLQVEVTKIIEEILPSLIQQALVKLESDATVAVSKLTHELLKSSDDE